MTHPDPETAGRLAAEAIVANLERLKQAVGGGQDAPLDRQLVAGELAAEAMKQLLGEAFTRLTPSEGNDAP